MLSMIMPLVPPVAAMAAVVIAPTFVHVIDLSCRGPARRRVERRDRAAGNTSCATCYQLDVVVAIENLGPFGYEWPEPKRWR